MILDISHLRLLSHILGARLSGCYFVLQQHMNPYGAIHERKESFKIKVVTLALAPFQPEPVRPFKTSHNIEIFDCHLEHVNPS